MIHRMRQWHGMTGSLIAGGVLTVLVAAGLPGLSGIGQSETGTGCPVGSWDGDAVTAMTGPGPALHSNGSPAIDRRQPERFQTATFASG
ncbi:hypothetical protein JW905_06465 [bacterium]|nr:hypothetical protein [candidate division CSSED10-310 bacterium]